MMAKMFYSLEEAKVALGKNEEEIKQFAREGKLREFRDGQKLMYKADQIESLKKELGGGAGGIELEDSPGSIPLEPGGSGSAIGLDSGRDESNLSAELGLSGSLGGMPSPRAPGGSVAGSKAGINIFGEDDGSGADPRAQTNISGGAREQINLEGVGSGSGLLDLTRESDDTSLGAELLDEVQGGGRKGGTSAGTMGDVDVAAASSGSAVLVNVEPPRPMSTRTAPVQIEAPDPLAPAFAGAALAAAIASLFAIFALFAGSMGAWPAAVKYFNTMSPLIMTGIGLGLAALLFIIGLFLGKVVR